MLYVPIPAGFDVELLMQYPQHRYHYLSCYYTNSVCSMFALIFTLITYFSIKYCYTQYSILQDVDDQYLHPVSIMATSISESPLSSISTQPLVLFQTLTAPTRSTLHGVVCEEVSTPLPLKVSILSTLFTVLSRL